MYVIPKIQWLENNTINTFIEYSIKYLEGKYYCFYGNGRYKEFNTLDDAKEWVEDIHYPAQVSKYFDRV